MVQIFTHGVSITGPRLGAVEQPPLGRYRHTADRSRAQPADAPGRTPTTEPRKLGGFAAASAGIVQKFLASARQLWPPFWDCVFGGKACRR